MPASLSTTDVSKRLDFVITGSLIEAMGFKPIDSSKGKPRWSEDDYPEICEKLAAYVKGRSRISVPAASVPAKGVPPRAAAKAQPTGQVSAHNGNGSLDDDDDEL